MKRVNLYLGIHKALRAVLFDAAAWTARTDFTDEVETAQATSALRRVLRMVVDHGEHEERWIHAHLRERAPETVLVIEGEHVRMDSSMNLLAELCAELEESSGDARALLGEQLHAELNCFVGDYLLHMHREETEGNAALWAHFSDAELLALQGELLTQIPPMRFAEWMQIMLPSMNAKDRATFVEELRGGAPSPIFRGFTRLAEQVLSDDQWAALQGHMGPDVDDPMPALAGLHAGGGPALPDSFGGRLA